MSRLSCLIRVAGMSPCRPRSPGTALAVSIAVSVAVGVAVGVASGAAFGASSSGSTPVAPPTTSTGSSTASSRPSVRIELSNLPTETTTVPASALRPAQPYTLSTRDAPVADRYTVTTVPDPLPAPKPRAAARCTSRAGKAPCKGRPVPRRVPPASP